MQWISLSLIAAFFYALRYIFVKKYLSQASSLVITFSVRFFGALLIAPLAFVIQARDVNAGLLMTTVLATSVLTAVSSVIQFYSVKNYDISSSLPFLSFVPFFMAFWVYIIHGALPGKYCIIGILLLCSGAYIIGRQNAGHTKQPAAGGGAALFFVSALILGLTTVLDKTAIESAGAGGVIYSICWNAFSALIFSPLFFAGKNSNLYISQFKSHFRHLFIQGVFGITAFAAQMLAVEYCRNSASNVVYVKSLTMLQIFFAVCISSVIFAERGASDRIPASALMIAGAAVIAAAK
ncbi:MAG TPA: DMT family transporter [Candidatus Wallbacteria bacterium]|nr:DMT family transporter [Candidatus Wallbacteria bacterium]